ncbi:MAG: MotA/TolQ/ExbB proton channel family protein [Planctomycetota bacterium]
MKSDKKTGSVFGKILFAGVFLTCSGGAFAQESAADAAGTFYHQFFTAGGPIVWFVLLPMSIMTVYLAVDLLVTVRRNRLLPSGLSSEIATEAMRHGINSLFARLAGQTDLISRAVLHSMDQRRQFGGSVESTRQYAAEALQERGLQLMRKAQWCQIIGSVAPMVGLFGTVFGMIRAFNLLGQGTEGPRYELLADAISVALVTTFWGLLVGIPALFFYGVFQTRVEAFVSEAAIETDSLLARIFEIPAPITDKPPSPESSDNAAV